MKDLFTGSLGKLNNHGGSRIFTTPNTRSVKPEYSVSTDVPNTAEFVICSLDGRLWLFRRSRRFYVAVFRWNESTQRLVFVKSKIFSNANFIGRGVDWLLTDTAIIQASDDEPYIRTVNLFGDNKSNFLYSILRSKDLSSGIDPITRKAWGLSETNGNSDGYGYFNRSALFQSVDKHYSQLPAIGDWHIIKNFLVRKADNPLSEAHNSMLNIRPLIPLEFNGSTPAYGCGFDNDIFLTYHNGELWGRGLYYIGRCYILPAVFDESGNPQEFYLYISPDYPRIAVAQADKFKLGILKTADNLYGFLTEQVSSLDNGLCYGSDNPKVFDASTKQWQQISESGQMFIDTLNHSGLVLNDDGAIFLNGASYECKGLKQWLAPAGVVEAVSAQSVISSFDNAAVATYPQQEFHRELLTGKKLPISAKSFSGKRLSLGLNDKAIQVNSLVGTNSAEAIVWQNVYKQPITIRKINSFSRDYVDINSVHPIFTDRECTGEHLIDFATLCAGYDGFWDWWNNHWGYWGYHNYIDEWGLKRSHPYFPFGNIIATGPSRNVEGDFVWGFSDARYNKIQKLFYIHPISGEPVIFCEANFFDDEIPGLLSNDLQTRLDWLSQDNFPDVDVPEAIILQGTQVGYSYTHYSNNLSSQEALFKPICSIPSEVSDWINNSGGNLTLQSIQIPKNIPQDITCSASAIFSEKNSKAIFACDIPSAFQSINGSKSGYLASLKNSWLQYYSYWNINSLSSDESFYTQGLHVAICESQNSEPLFIVFRSEIQPEIFDFKSQTERSKLS